METPSLIFLRLEGGETLQPMLLFVQFQPTTMHIQVSPDGRFNWDYTPMPNRPGLVTVDDQDGERLLLTTDEARAHWRSYIAQGWQWV